MCIFNKPPSAADNFSNKQTSPAPKLIVFGHKNPLRAIKINSIAGKKTFPKS